MGRAKFIPGLFVALSIAPALVLVAFPLISGASYALKMGTGIFTALFASPFFKSSIFFSFAVAAFTTIVVTGIGALSAYLFCDRTGALFAKAYVMLPYLAAASFVANTFGDSGITAHVLKIFYPPLSSLGIRFHPLGIGVILACLYKQIPFVFLSLSGVFFALREKYFETASTLGAGPLAIFYRVFLPNAFRPLAGVAILVFQFTLFNYETFAFLGPSAPKGLGELMVLLYYSANETEKALAMDLCTLVFAASCISGILLAVCMFGGRRKEA